MEKIKQFFIYGSEKGLPLLAAFDAISGKPSITLLSVHVTLWLTVGILLFSLKYEASNQFWGALAFWAIANVFYLIRKVTKFKFDADDKFIELEGGDDEKTSV